MSAHSRKHILYFFGLIFLGFSCMPDKPEEKIVREVLDYSSKAREALNYCKANKLNTSFFILIDLSVHSGYKRFFIWDFSRACITDSFLVSHGCGTHPWGQYASCEDPMISNDMHSHCSSVGKYIIGERGHSQWGVKTKYLLHGMDPTNSNACRRQIVFHSWEGVGDREIYPHGVREGWGCPAISNKAFVLVDQKIRRQSQRVLMWIIKE